MPNEGMYTKKSAKFQKLLHGIALGPCGDLERASKGYRSSGGGEAYVYLGYYFIFRPDGEAGTLPTKIMNFRTCFQLINQKYTGGTPLGHRVVIFASPDSENIKEDTKEGMVMEAIYGLANEMTGVEEGPFSLFKFTLVKGTASKRVEVDLPKVSPGNGSVNP
ncbi:hypothetical protein SELMODRAFT_418786 [Selaginella moellendorffii]|uniref:Uncharacterized protein n=1 Tax=Selaginella moellendorffii TaxID=88036 RepID=D8S6D7_SELML|nr:hypothetical protein SELMODRAFT_418786 [Selaginella moellendorffii]